MRLQNSDDDSPKLVWRHVLRASLDDTRAALLPVGEEDAEIEFVGENHAGVVPRLLHNLGIGRVVSTDGRPMNGVEPALVQVRHPLGRKIHVEEKPHAIANGTSTSSTRQAA